MEGPINESVQFFRQRFVLADPSERAHLLDEWPRQVRAS
jgi:hypothetical protein